MQKCRWCLAARAGWEMLTNAAAHARRSWTGEKKSWLRAAVVPRKLADPVSDRFKKQKFSKGFERTNYGV
jgi:hypothetical protein